MRSAFCRGVREVKVTSRSRRETRPYDVPTRTWRFPIIFQGKTVRNSHFMNSVFTFDHFRFARYLRIAFISYEYEFVAVVWLSSVSESCQNFCLRFEWVTSRPRRRPQLTRSNYNLPFFFYRNDCLILVFKSSTNYFFFVRKMSEKSGGRDKTVSLPAC